MKQFFVSTGAEFFTMYWKNMGSTFVITHYHYLDANTRQRYLIDNYGTIHYDVWKHFVSAAFSLPKRVSGGGTPKIDTLSLCFL